MALKHYTSTLLLLLCVSVAFGQQCTGFCPENLVCSGYQKCLSYAGLIFDASSNTLAYTTLCNKTTVRIRVKATTAGQPQEIAVLPNIAGVTALRTVGYFGGGIFIDRTMTSGSHSLFRQSTSGGAARVVFANGGNYRGFFEREPRPASLLGSALGDVFYVCEKSGSSIVVASYKYTLNLVLVRRQTHYIITAGRTCGPMRRSTTSDKLYISQSNGTHTSIYEGNVGCTGCTLPSASSIVVGDPEESIVFRDFDVNDSDYLVATNVGLYTSSIPVEDAATNVMRIDYPYSDDTIGVAAGATNARAYTLIDQVIRSVDLTSASFNNILEERPGVCV